ncbi:CoA-binding protein [Haloferacaceae archaeon DSL9]
MTQTDDETLGRLLELDRIAVIGCSTTPGKAAHEIPAYLQRHGYDIIPVNPSADEILGEPAADSLADVDAEIDLVNVFRPSDEVAGIVQDVLRRVEERGDVKAIWMQLGIADDAAAATAMGAGLDVVQDRCMKVEHGRLVR